ncbi:NAD-dependent epimerase [Microbulbifer sp. CAU 1566]|uniref:NAD-dependent epimerase n=1 Tax=Microbulbifer sp. CAU 1566 TaxID=2933269 RepID=UPI0020057BA3|nr:NAD-dependent epimerase [Microbulbifer sp. CAU 1566]MCK7597357.1 NAD-dependent epimerase [Microbulbifer sp. CAU 1566]
MNILVTGAAGFIGFHVASRLCALGVNVVGLDNLNNYYDVKLKEDRIAKLRENRNFRFELVDLADRSAISDLFDKISFNQVIHLGAQAGVRYSLENPGSYVDSNLVGMCNILEGCRSQQVNHLVYASSSSVYGLNKKSPFSESDTTDHPVSLYAATKKANEVLAHSYSSLYNIPTSGLRFFTVYGPWGRPDMALFKFTKAILEGSPIDIYNNGYLSRDFTYIDDIVEGILRVAECPPVSVAGEQSLNFSPYESSAPFRLLNIGNGRPIRLLDFITALEEKLNKKAVRNYLPMQPGDVYETCADSSLLEGVTNYTPHVDLIEGVGRFVDWYCSYYSITPR